MQNSNGELNVSVCSVNSLKRLWLLSKQKLSSVTYFLCSVSRF